MIYIISKLIWICISIGNPPLVPKVKTIVCGKICTAIVYDFAEGEGHRKKGKIAFFIVYIFFCG